MTSKVSKDLVKTIKLKYENIKSYLNERSSRI